jgi:hypothetical protein
MPQFPAVINFLAIAAAAAAQPCEPEWSALGEGLNGAVFALEVFDDGTGPGLYVGGSFNEAGGLPALSLARWDGGNWSAVPDGPLTENMGAPFIGAMAVYDDGRGPALYVGGMFAFAGGKPAANIARFDGQQWESLDGGLGQGCCGHDTVYDLQVADLGDGPVLIAGGWRLSTEKGVDGSGAALWDGHTWTALKDENCCYVWWEAGGIGPAFGNIVPIQRGAETGLLGRGIVADGQGWAYRVALHMQAGWSFLDEELAQQLGPDWHFASAMARMEKGGWTTFLGAGPSVAVWRGQMWEALPPLGGYPGSVRCLIDHDDGIGTALYAGGNFDPEEGAAASGIARWDGTSWSPLGEGISTGMYGVVRAMATFDDGLGAALFAGGEFTVAGGLEVGNIARWGCPTCYADCNTDGSLDFFDFVCFINLFNTADPRADCDDSGGLDLFDFLCFVNAFNQGC